MKKYTFNKIFGQLKADKIKSLIDQYDFITSAKESYITFSTELEKV